MALCKPLPEISAVCRHILGENLTGIYVHGSIAFGCYRPDISDVDFIIVVEEEPDLNDKMALIQALTALESPQKGLEMSVVLRRTCLNFVYPTPFVLHYSNAYREACQQDLRGYCMTMHGVDRDLAAHFMVIRNVGFTLYGAPVEAIFGDVPAECYLDSLRCDLQEAVAEADKNPVYAILNLCRTLAYVREGLILSKQDGGRWGLTHLSEAYRPLIEAALAVYDGKASGGFDNLPVKAFCAEAYKQIFD